MNAIPTRYAGVQFRSRLEARWAAMFDLLGWTWEYEPIDLAGYIPDFVVEPGYWEKTIFEVKPILGWPSGVDHGFMCIPAKDRYSFHMKKLPIDGSSYDEAIRKMRDSGWTGTGVLVGASLFTWESDKPDNRVPCIGRKVNNINGNPDLSIQSCRKCSRKFLVEDTQLCDLDEYDDFGEYVTWCGCCDKDTAYGMPFDVTSLWREAGNRVQWRAPEPAR